MTFKTRVNILIILIATLIIASMASCSPEKRLARIIRNHPELMKTDTVFKKDTVITKLVQKDTSFHFYQPDTVYIKEGKMTIKYVTRKDSTVYINGKCDPDTIIRDIPFYVNKIEPENSTWKQRIKIWIIDNALLIALIVIILYKSFGTAIKTFLKIK